MQDFISNNGSDNLTKYKEYKLFSCPVKSHTQDISMWLQCVIKVIKVEITKGNSHYSNIVSDMNSKIHSTTCRVHNYIQKIAK